MTLHTLRYCLLAYSVLGEVISYTIAMPLPRDRYLHSPVTLRTCRYCLLSYSLLEEVISYGYLMGDRFLHLLVTLRTRRYCLLAYSVLGELVSYVSRGVDGNNNNNLGGTVHDISIGN